LKLTDNRHLNGRMERTQGLGRRRGNSADEVQDDHKESDEGDREAQKELWELSYLHFKSKPSGCPERRERKYKGLPPHTEDGRARRKGRAKRSVLDGIYEESLCYLTDNGATLPFL
jgi:hypothetical protein